MHFKSLPTGADDGLLFIHSPSERWRHKQKPHIQSVEHSHTQAVRSRDYRIDRKEFCQRKAFHCSPSSA